MRYADDRILVLATLFLVCALLSAVGLGAVALWAFLPIGLVTGCLNIIVGVIGPVLGALMTYTPLKKEAVVGTLGWFGVIGNLTKIAGFSAIGFSFAPHRVHAQQIDKEVIAQGADIVSQHTMAGTISIGTQCSHSTQQHSHLRNGQTKLIRFDHQHFSR